MNNISRSSIDALKPPGVIWEPEQDKDLDNQWNGIADGLEESRLKVDDLKDIRNPYKTPVFNDLERNYGIAPNPNISTKIKQDRLAQKVYQGEKVNALEDLQRDLNTAGFDLQVHRNDPPVDPNIFLTQAFNMTAGSDNAFAGYNEGAENLAFAGSLGGELLVNTPLFLQSPAFDMQAGGEIAYAGYNEGDGVLSVAGYFTGLRQQKLTYPIPADPGYWGQIFFIGGNAERNEAGELISIESGMVDSNRRDDLQSLILADKALIAWCGLIINFR